MTTAVRDRTGPVVPEKGRRAGKSRRCLARLADPRVRLGVGAAGLLATALPVHADRVGEYERRAFRAVNGLPDQLYVPAWVIMQLGTFGAVPATAVAAWLAGDRRLAWRLAVGGSATWALAKVVKQRVRRPRPADLLAGTRRRGRDASGLGYLSGHAGVATALGAATFHRLGPTGRVIVLTVVPIVGLSRAYVGAHLPLDIVGGAALGLAVDAATVLTGRAVRGCGMGEPRQAERVTPSASCATRTSGPTSRGRARRP
jgi:hypothetical protein